MKLKYLLIIVLFCYSDLLIGQEITDENHEKFLAEIWDTYEVKSAELLPIGNNTENRDRLRKDLLEETLTLSAKAAIKYASVPSGLDQLFRSRLRIPKDTLRLIYNTLPIALKESQNGKKLLLHITTDQVEEMGPYQEIEATGLDGNQFQFSEVKSKNILFIYGGLGCMREQGRSFLKEIYEATDRSDLEVVVFFPTNSLVDLKGVLNIYPEVYVAVSDFLGNDSPVKITYGAQATPTVYVINSDGIVVLKEIGLNDDRDGRLVKVLNELTSTQI